MYLDNYKILQKHCSKTHLYKKIIFGQKDMQSFSKVLLLAHLILFTTMVKSIN
jgi:hypothetical protein